MKPSTSNAESEPLRAIGIPPPVTELVETIGVRALSERLAAPLWSSLWVEGPTGCGKTTATAAALDRLQDFSGILRIDCSPSQRLEEILYSVADFLLQLGFGELKHVLNQRSALQNKLSVLFQTVTDHPVVIWLDDLDSIRAGPLADGSDGLVPFLHSCAALPETSAGRIVVTSRNRPVPGVSIERWTLPALSLADSRRFWDSLSSSSLYPEVPWPATGFPPDLESSPLTLRLLFACHTLGGRDTVDELLKNELAGSEVSCGMAELYAKVIDLLNPTSRELLEILAHFGRPLSRGGLRYLSVVTGHEVSFDTDTVDSRLLDLDRSALVRVADAAGGTPGLYTLHPIVLDAVRSGAHLLSTDRKEALFVAAADYFLRFASNKDDLWPLYNARECYFKAGRFDQACQVHKCFIEEMLRLGYFDAAREVLSETIETTSGNTRAVSRGNLALIYKNEARYDQALELYEQVRSELLALGDQSNLARVLHQIGNVHYLREDLSSALECYQKSFDLSDELEEEAIATATRVQIANILYQLGDEEDALGYYNEIAAKLRQGGQEKNAGLVGAVLVQMGQIHQKAKRYLEAESQFAAAKEVVLACDDRRSLIKVLRAQAMVARERREYDEALLIYEDATRTAAELGDIVEAATCAVLMGDLEKDRVQLGRAMKFYAGARDVLHTRPAARVATKEQIDAVLRLVDERLAELEKTMGGEAFARARKKHWDRDVSSD